MRALARQRGWAAILALLIVVAIIAVLAGTIVRQYGGAGGASAEKAQGAAGGVEAADPAAAAEQGVAPAPRDALNRARALEGEVKQQAEDLDKRIDEQSK